MKKYSERVITDSLKDKVFEAIERTEHSGCAGSDGPPEMGAGVFRGQCASVESGHLLGHLLDCLAGFCAVLPLDFRRKCGSFSSFAPFL